MGIFSNLSSTSDSFCLAPFTRTRRHLSAATILRVLTTALLFTTSFLPSLSGLYLLSQPVYYFIDNTTKIDSNVQDSLPVLTKTGLILFTILSWVLCSGYITKHLSTRSSRHQHDIFPIAMTYQSAIRQSAGMIPFLCVWVVGLIGLTTTHPVIPAQKGVMMSDSWMNWYAISRTSSWVHGVMIVMSCVLPLMIWKLRVMKGLEFEELAEIHDCGVCDGKCEHGIEEKVMEQTKMMPIEALLGIEKKVAKGTILKEDAFRLNGNGEAIDEEDEWSSDFQRIRA